ncbi:helix-turn-helix transcriptional regulator [Bradyrhizobium lablabi]|uniref:helix-turn-helix transcriptional regulator n=1 Tax=Bradyrhizobium lablabi TaxID=722472 RepID=UPI0020120B9B|nr:AraC family transcriptional regulator [Bradyrhizobium lablabi]
MTFLYLPKEQFAEGANELIAKLHFEDMQAWETASKLYRALESGQQKPLHYLDALSNVLAHELTRADSENSRVAIVCRGGLASWQRRVVSSYIEDHLADHFCLATLARLVRLSPHHFCRAFKRSFGVPPHQYQVMRRVEQAKLLLADRDASVTDVGLALGYSQTSSFSLTFRRITGWSPSEYRREIQQ